MRLALENFNVGNPGFFASGLAKTFVPITILRPDICKHWGETHERDFVNVSDWQKIISANKWKTIKVREGHKGWLTVKLVACRVRAKIENEIGDEETLIVSKWREDNGKPHCDYYLSWSNEPTDLHEYARVIKQAYRIEESFRRAKIECGLANYQVRNWMGWHHHVALSLLTLWFLTMELLNQKNVPMMTLQQVRECISGMLLSERLKVCDQSVVGSPSAKRIPLFPLDMLAQQNQASHRKLLESLIFANFVVVTC